jgi:hypothetical protein
VAGAARAAAGDKRRISGRERAAPQGGRQQGQVAAHVPQVKEALSHVAHWGSGLSLLPVAHPLVQPGEALLPAPAARPPQPPALTGERGRGGGRRQGKVGRSGWGGRSGGLLAPRASTGVQMVASRRELIPGLGEWLPRRKELLRA